MLQAIECPRPSFRCEFERPEKAWDYWKYTLTRIKQKMKSRKNFTKTLLHCNHFHIKNQFESMKKWNIYFRDWLHEKFQFEKIKKGTWFLGKIYERVNLLQLISRKKKSIWANKNETNSLTEKIATKTHFKIFCNWFHEKN